LTTDFFVYFSPSRDDEGCTLEAFSIILFCASKLALSEYLQTLADCRLLIISTQRAKDAPSELTQSDPPTPPRGEKSNLMIQTLFAYPAGLGVSSRRLRLCPLRN